MRPPVKFLTYLIIVMAPASILRAMPDSANAPQTDESEPFQRTCIEGDRIGSLTGRWLRTGDRIHAPERAWVAIAQKTESDSLKHIILARQRANLRRLAGEWQTDDTERCARIRHGQTFLPVYFDAVIFETRSDPGDAIRYCVVDADMDGRLDDESLFLCCDGCFLRHGFRIATPRRPQIKPQAAARQEPTAARETFDASPEDPLNVLYEQLVKLDTVVDRKQNLANIVMLSNRIVARRDEGSTEKFSLSQLADTLYRRGRALGYMELPDVVITHPVQDPAWLQQEFESTFRRLDDLVNTKKPAYILLRIRRERRRGQRGAALDLVEHYRKTHPDPAWQFKKRFDLMKELHFTWNARQAAAELWLNARLPRPPIPVIIVLEPSSAAPVVMGSWTDRDPLRSVQLTFQSVSDVRMESVVWLEEGKTYRLTGATTENGGAAISVTRQDNVFPIRLERPADVSP